MRVAIVGVSGFVGTNLTECLLKNSKHTILGLCQNPEKAKKIAGFDNRYTLHHGDVFKLEEMTRELQGCEVAVYLVHMMANKQEHFIQAEERAATTFATAVKNAGVRRVVYMSGLGSDNDNLSEHLRSRHNTGDILRKFIPEVIECRASMIIGPGSISFDIVRELVSELPGLILPWSAGTHTQPIALPDALQYLMGAITLPITKHEIVEIGGPEAMSYREFIHRYAKFKHKFFLMIRVPFLPESIAAWGLNIFTPTTHARVGEHMVASFKNKMVVTNNRANELFPNIKPRKVEASFV